MRRHVATAKDLRQRTAALLGAVRRGDEVVITYRGKQVALLAPLERSDDKPFAPIGFGMWKQRRDMRDVTRWLKRRRGFPEDNTDTLIWRFSAGAPFDREGGRRR